MTVKLPPSNCTSYPNHAHAELLCSVTCVCWVTQISGCMSLYTYDKYCAETRRLCDPIKLIRDTFLSVAIQLSCQSERWNSYLYMYCSGFWSVIAVGLFIYTKQAQCNLHATFEGLCYCELRLPPLVRE